jgi:predicted ArsR family transcriptional regulator
MTSAVKEPAEKSGVIQKLITYGSRLRPAVRDPKKVLVLLYSTQGKSLDEIAVIFNVTRQAIAYNAERLGVATGQPGRPETMLGKIKDCGFDSVGDYFRAHATKTFEAMARELSVSSSTIQRHYDLFIRSITSASA